MITETNMYMEFLLGDTLKIRLQEKDIIELIKRGSIQDKASNFDNSYRFNLKIEIDGHDLEMCQRLYEGLTYKKEEK
jgi:hypothetical protein